jgi:hypothetical protein
METRPVPQLIVNLLATLLNRQGLPVFEVDENGYSQIDWIGPWKLEFRRIGPGHGRHPAKSTIEDFAIGMEIERLIRRGSRTKAAIGHAIETHKVGQSRAFRALRLARAFLQTAPPEDDVVKASIPTEVTRMKRRGPKLEDVERLLQRLRALRRDPNGRKKTTKSLRAPRN